MEKRPVSRKDASLHGAPIEVVGAQVVTLVAEGGGLEGGRVGKESVPGGRRPGPDLLLFLGSGGGRCVPCIPDPFDSGAPAPRAVGLGTAILFVT